ncbi:hypothetical protein ASE69_20115 [Sphingomonas sp. Leaf208]|nr:hypothetical protein ASE69_20115 [Sphingomonas sp. Leaf208]
MLKPKTLDMSLLRSKKAVPFAEIVQNIRCDVKRYLEVAQDKSFSIGVVLTATTQNDKQIVDKIGATVPVAPSIAIALAAQKSNGVTYGSKEEEAFVVYNNPALKGAEETPLTKCEATTLTDGTPKVLDGPLLNLATRRKQLNDLEKGTPHVQIRGFTREGSILLVDAGGGSAGVKAYFVTFDASMTKTASYRIDYKLASNWQPLIAPFDIAKTKEPEPPAPTVMYIINAKEPPKPGKKPKPTDPIIPMSKPETYSVTIPWAVNLLGVTPPMTPAQKKAVEEAEKERKAKADPALVDKPLPY